MAAKNGIKTKGMNNKDDTALNLLYIGKLAINQFVTLGKFLPKLKTNPKIIAAKKNHFKLLYFFRRILLKLKE